MIKRIAGLVFCIVPLAVGVGAQTTVTTTGGTTGTIPMFTASGTIGNSASPAITISSGNVGIGTATPIAPLHVASDGVAIQLGTETSAGSAIAFEHNSSGSYNRTQAGYSTTVYGSDTGFAYLAGGPTKGTALIVNGDFTDSPSLYVNSAGKVGIGTVTPNTKLEVDGNVTLTAGSGASITFQDGTVQSTAYTGVVCGGDYAESVDVMGSRTKYEPGDLLVIDPNDPGRFLKSAEAYSTLVAGIYSTKPGTVGRRETTYAKTDTTPVPMAMMGIVPTKVSTENGAIKTGDLLVTSSTLGYAMKGTDRSRLTGAVVGKALGSLDAGTGVIEVLVTLQ